MGAMGSVYQRAPGIWRIYYDAPPAWEEGKKRRRQKTETIRGSRHDALTRLTVVEAQIATGTYIEPIEQPVGQWMLQWLGTKTNLVDSSAQLYQNIIRDYIGPSLGATRVCDLRAEHIEQALAVWQRRSLDMARRAVVLLRQVLKQAHQRGRLPRNEALLVQLPKLQHREMRYLRLEEISRLLERCSTLDEFGPAIAIACCTGLRAGELLGLQWGDVDLAGKRLHVQRAMRRVRGQGKVCGPPKTASSVRVVRMMADVVPFFEQQRRWQRDITGYWPANEAPLFTQHMGGPLDHSNLYRAFVAVLDELGLPRIRFHDSRHSFATWALSAGVPVKVVSEALGHANPTITMTVYQHVLPDMQEAGMGLMSAALQAQTVPAEKEAK